MSMITHGETDQRKLFVLDTNVCLHDADCIRKFEENDLALPITVLEELDNIKKRRWWHPLLSTPISKVTG